MINSKVKKLPKNTFEIEATIPWAEIEKEEQKAFNALQAQLELKGYRKGKVPTELAKQHLAKDAIYQQMIRSFMPAVYDEVIKKENLKPIMSPRIDLKKAKENEDWEIVFKVAEKPTVNLKNYKEVIKKAKNDAKTPDIWVPGKDKATPPPEANQQQLINAALTALLKEAECEIPEILIEEELNNRLSRLVDDIQKLGLTTDAYLKSKNLTMDDLKAQYSKEIEEMYKLEFLLLDIADNEQIKVEEKDLDALFGTIKDDKEKKLAEQNAYFYASILRKQKTLDFLTNL